MAKTQKTETQYTEGIKNVETVDGYITVPQAAAMFEDVNVNNIGYFLRSGKVDAVRLGKSEGQSGVVLVKMSSWKHYYTVVRPQELASKEADKARREQEKALDDELKAEEEKLRAKFEERKAALAKGATSGK